MGWGNRRWQDDEAVFDNAHGVVTGDTDEDIAAALVSALLLESAGGDN